MDSLALLHSFLEPGFTSSNVTYSLPSRNVRSNGSIEENTKVIVGYVCGLGFELQRDFHELKREVWSEFAPESLPLRVHGTCLLDLIG